jgi:acetyl esterase/lipase
VTIEVVKSEFKNPDDKPDLMDLRYGPNAKHVFDVYYPDERGDEPLPVIMFIHGGGWGAFNKSGAQKMVKSVTGHGYALIAISYRYISEAGQAPGEMVPPVSAPLYDAARAIQHVRYHADELGIDPDRIGITGGSAGGASCIWIALHDDLADPDAEDPISRMSTKPQCAVPVQAQSSLDPIQVREWVPAMSYGGHAFLSSKELGDKDERYDNWRAKRPEILDWIKVFSPYEHASADDPPMFFHNVGRKNVPDEDPTHHPKHTEMMAKRLNEVGAKAWFWAEDQDSGEARYDERGGVWNFWEDHLKNAKN